MRNVSLYLFASVKGGVGKSTLAVVTAELLASRGRHPIVLDCDVLGSSLADGLDLCAPETSTSGGRPDPMAPPTEQWFSLERSRALREQRKESWAVDGAERGLTIPPYINDALFFDTSKGNDCRVDAMLWRNASTNGARYLPSSPIREEASRAAVLLARSGPEFAWVRRIAWMIEGLLSEDDSVTDIIVDLPPGTWGLTHELLVFAGGLGRALPQGYPQWEGSISWSVVPTIVTTPDRNDRLLALEYWLYAKSRIKSLRVLMNRAVHSDSTYRAWIRDELPKPLRGLGYEKQVLLVPLLSTSLGGMFVRGDLTLSDDVQDLSSSLLGKEAQDA
ncbi:MAG: P-loop NTPase [Nannocystaceae bacterium]|nr:P-loop NTPase [Nannocystaceae bacterium]